MKSNKGLLALSIVLALVLAPTAIAAPNLSNKAAGRTGTTTVNTILSGVGVPSKNLGINGDFYIDTKNANLYGPKTNGVWKLTTSLRALPTKANPTVPGATGTTGAAGTAGAAGVIGPRGLPGATGEKGATGTAGLPGIAGANGLPGAAGAPGTAGAPGAAGTNGILNSYFVDIGNWSLKSTDTLGRSNSSVFGNLSVGSFTFEILIDGTFSPNTNEIVSIGMQLTSTGGSLEYRAFASDSKANINGVSGRHVGFIIIGRIICTGLTSLQLTSIHGSGLSSSDSLNFSGRALINQVGAIG
jgi:hypothetical protein